VQDEKRPRRSVVTPLVALACLAIALGIFLALRRASRDTPRAGELPAAQIDINTADAATLMVLPSIGSALSQRIVEDRAANGPYGRPEDLLRVRGVTVEVLERIRPFLVGFTHGDDARPEASS